MIARSISDTFEAELIGKDITIKKDFGPNDMKRQIHHGENGPMYVL